MDRFAENIKFLRLQKQQTQEQAANGAGFKQSAWNNYEKGRSKPNFEDLMKIIKYFDITASELLETEISNVHLMESEGSYKKSKIVHPIVHPNVHLNAKKEAKANEINITVSAESEHKMVPIPITDISVAAGEGHYNADYISNVESIRLPINLVKKNQTYLCVKIKGASMAPTLQDGGYVVIRLLDRGEWAKMPDERIYVVSDYEGKSYLKRVKNRFNQGLIVLRSDSPDQVNYPNFNLTNEEINTIWIVEWYFSAKLPNIHDQYYTRLQRLEDKLDDLIISNKKIQR